jgi:hypothetical protein
MMAPRKKITGAEYIACFVRNDRPDSKVPWLTDIFVFGQTVEDLNTMIQEDRYGLRARGFEHSGTFRLVPMASGKWRLPTCGAYENVQWLYKGESDAEESSEAVA